jgi:Tfp pilus assembly protein PilP
MRRRRVIEGVVGGILMLWLVGGTGAAWSWAAEAKTVFAAATSVGVGDTGAVKTPVALSAASPGDRSRVVSKPDPFRPFIETEVEKKISKEEALSKKGGGKSRPLSPLQQSEIGQYRLVGIAGNDDKRTAIVVDGTAKRFYPLFVGTYIGPNEGRVAEILSDRVIVEERIEDPTKKEKKAQTQRVTMMLHKEE